MAQQDEITVYKLDAMGEEVWYYGARVLRREPHSIMLEAYFDRDEVNVGPVVFREGDRFVETFYSDRWYNVFAVYDGKDGERKGWYCNICRPAHIGAEALRCEDLALDIWVGTGGDVHLLDEDEFLALPLPLSHRHQAEAARDELLQLATTGTLPG